MLLGTRSESKIGCEIASEAPLRQTSRYQYHLRFVANPHERQSDHRQILSVPICLTSIQGAREQLKGPDHTFLFSLSP